MGDAGERNSALHGIRLKLKLLCSFSVPCGGGVSCFEYHDNSGVNVNPKSREDDTFQLRHIRNIRSFSGIREELPTKYVELISPVLGSGRLTLCTFSGCCYYYCHVQSAIGLLTAFGRSR